MRVGLNFGSVGRRAGLGPAPTESPERRLPLRRAGCFHARAPGGPVCRPYKIRGTLRSFRRGRSQTGPGAALGRSPHPSGLTASPPTPFGLQPFPPDRGNRPSPKGEGFWAAKGRPYGGKRPGSVGSANPGAEAEPHQSQFSSRSGPQWGRTGPHPSTPVLRAGNFLPTSRGNPRNGGPGADSPCQGEMSRSDRGGRVGEYGHAVSILSRPPAILWFLSHRWERNSPPAGGETPLRTTNAVRNLPPHPAPSGPPDPIPSGLRPSPLDKGSRPPGGRLRKGRRRNSPAPIHSPITHSNIEIKTTPERRYAP